MSLTAAATLDDSAEALLHLLGDAQGVYQQEHAPYGYPGVPQQLGIHDLAEHLAGRIAIGFSLAHRGGDNRIVAIDIDEHFIERLPAIRDVIHMRDRELAQRRWKRDCRRKHDEKNPIRGETNFEGATFCTNGSRPGRGKVLIPFAKPRSRSAMANFIAGLVNEARLDPRWGPETPQSIEYWPMTGIGVCKPIRIGGRSRKPSASMEQFFNLNGEVIDLREVVPVRGNCLQIFARPEPASAPMRSSERVAHALKAGVSKRGPGGTRTANRTLYGWCRDWVAREVGLAEAQELVRKIVDKSPDLFGPSAKNKDTRNPLSPDCVAQAYRRAYNDFESECRHIEQSLGVLNAKTHRRTRKCTAGTMGGRTSYVHFVKGEAPNVHFSLFDAGAIDKRRRLDPEEALSHTELALRSYCLHKNITPLIFAITSRELGRLLGIGASGALRRIAKLEEADRLKIYDRGTGMRLPLLLGLSDAKANVDLIQAMLKVRDQRKSAIVRKRAFGRLKDVAEPNSGVADFVREERMPL